MMYRCQNCLYWIRYSKRVYGKSGYCRLESRLKNATEEICKDFIFFEKEAREKFAYFTDPGDGFPIEKKEEEQCPEQQD